MIRWLVKSLDVHPDLVRGEAPVGLLAAAESAELDAFKVRKRRQDWLLGRWTAKHLVQAHLTETTGHTLPLDQLTIKHEAAGAPYVTLHDVTPECPLPVSLSISHSNGYAFCALYDARLDENLEPNARAAAVNQITIGADIEHIEPRERSFITDFFTSSEIATIEQMPASQQATLVTAIWSAKEAVLKALRVGLRVDTRAIDCKFTPLPSEIMMSNDWTPFGIETALQGTATLGQFTGWWRTLDNFVLTLAVRSGQDDLLPGR
ncbi:MAG: 4'-phosphopantetheinyl transferase superfamily protein [Caldilineaceae bacterium]